MADKKEKKEEEKVKVEDMKTLMEKTIESESDYKTRKFLNEMDYNKHLINTDWDTINEERKEQGLSKLSNQDMKKAYIQQEIMYEEYKQESEYEMTYNEYRRMFDVAMKYSYDILR